MRNLKWTTFWFLEQLEIFWEKKLSISSDYVIIIL